MISERASASSGPFALIVTGWCIVAVQFSANFPPEPSITLVRFASLFAR
jgi:hypothetical protein